MPQYVLAIIVGLAVCQIAIVMTTVFLHRTVAHKAVQLSPGVRLLFRFLVWITTGIKPREWAAVHRRHHAYTDVEGDPHSPVLLGYWRIQLTNAALYRRTARDGRTVDRYAKDLAPDAWDRVLFDRPFLGLGIGIAILCVSLGWQYGLLAAAVHVLTYLVLNAAINAFGHVRGKQYYENTAYNLQWLAFLTAGEGLHNNHHAAPTSAQLSHRRGEIDPGWWLIRLLVRLHWAKVRLDAPRILEQFLRLCHSRRARHAVMCVWASDRQLPKEHGVTRLNDLYTVGGQSPWIDDLKRSYLTTGELHRKVESGVRGMTSNPTIMTKAIEDSADYDEQFNGLIRSGMSVADAYWELVLADVTDALEVFRPLYDDANGGDGFVSVEVAPNLAADSEGTTTSALQLHQRIARPNLLVKIPATVAGLPAIEETIAHGHSVNVTLIFSLERYDAVIEAYLRGLERFAEASGDLHPVASVASFFVSRVDTEVDRRLDQIAASDPGSKQAERALALRGRTAVAQARLAYALFEQKFSTPRAKALLDKGARRQRPLWASTSTKNPAYPDLLYVDELIGPDTVNTMPPATIDAFLDHGNVKRSIDTDLDDSREVLTSLGEVGVDLDDVTAQLEAEGVASFLKSFDELHEQLQRKAVALGAAK